MKVNEKGRVVIPKRLREKHGLHPGTDVDVHEEDGTVVIERQLTGDEYAALVHEKTDEIRDRPVPKYESLPPMAKSHVDIIRRGGEKAVEAHDPDDDE